jgi:hypothetical protein
MGRPPSLNLTGYCNDIDRSRYLSFVRHLIRIRPPRKADVVLQVAVSHAKDIIPRTRRPDPVCIEHLLLVSDLIYRRIDCCLCVRRQHVALVRSLAPPVCVDISRSFGVQAVALHVGLLLLGCL